MENASLFPPLLVSTVAISRYDPSINGSSLKLISYGSSNRFNIEFTAKNVDFPVLLSPTKTVILPRRADCGLSKQRIPETCTRSLGDCIKEVNEVSESVIYISSVSQYLHARIDALQGWIKFPEQAVRRAVDSFQCLVRRFAPPLDNDRPARFLDRPKRPGADHR